MKCSNCKTVVQLEDEDKPRFRAQCRPNVKQWVEIDCPSCGAVIQHDEAPMRQVIPENTDADTPAYFFPSPCSSLSAGDAAATMSCINFLGATRNF